MYRGTTPTLVFTFEEDLQSMDIENMYFTFNQGNQTKIEKDLSSVSITTNKVLINLSQQDTLNLDNSSAVEIQCRFKLNGGQSYATNIIKTSVEKILKEGEI